MKNNWTGLLKQLSDDETNLTLYLTNGNVPLGGLIHFKGGADYVRFLNPETNIMAYIPLDKILFIVPND
jgi:hypothetical protein